MCRFAGEVKIRRRSLFRHFGPLADVLSGLVKVGMGSPRSMLQVWSARLFVPPK